MASKQSEKLKTLYASWKRLITPDMSLEEQRDLIDDWAVITAEPRGVDYAETEAGGVPALWAVPKGAAQDRVILSIHGGGFITGSMYTHRKLFGHIAKASGARALIVNYRLAPEHVHPAPLDDIVSAYRWLLSEGVKPAHIAFAGDSSGGGLAVTAQLRAREQGLPLPAASMPISPWVDMEVTGESMISNRDKDALFTKEMVQSLAATFLGPLGNRRDPLANPLYADLRGLPPIYIQVGGDEMNRDDGVQLAQHARKAGVDVRIDIFPEQQHTFQMGAGRAPEADHAIRKLAQWVRPKLGLPVL